MPLLITEKLVDSENDSVLSPFLSAPDAASAEHALIDLIAEHIRPRLNEIVSYKLRAFANQTEDLEEIADVESEALSQLLVRLNDLRTDPHRSPIRNLRGYIAVTAYHVCHDYLRRKYPQRASLKQKLRYTMSRQPGFGCWEITSGEWVCGLAVWRNDARQQVAAESLVQKLQNQLGDFAGSRLPRGTAQGIDLADLLAAVFDWIGQPIELDHLVGIVAELQGIKDELQVVETDNGELRARLEQMPDGHEAIADELAERAFLIQLWQEIEQMSSRHCTALLLNLRDEQGGSALDLFVFTGAASFAQVADSMGMTELELATVWNQLPIDDLTIAARLGTTRQQVINLRKAARERLARRLR